MILQTARDGGGSNADIMMLYISAMDHARKLKFNIYVYLLSINKMFQYRYACVTLGSVGDGIIFEHSSSKSKYNL